MIRAAIAEDVAFEREALEKHLRRFAGERGEEVTCDTFENGEALLLVDTAERPEDIDANRARRAADAAKEVLQQKRSIQEYRSALATLARAINRLQVKKNYQSWNK